MNPAPGEDQREFSESCPEEAVVGAPEERNVVSLSSG